MTMFHLLKIIRSIDIFKKEKCKVTFGLEYTTAIRSLYRHVVCNGPISCKFNGIGNKLEEW